MRSVPLSILAGLLSLAAPTNDPPSMDPEVRTHPWHDTAHHAPGGGFRNTWAAPRDASPLRAFGWIAGHAFERKENVPPPVHPVDPDSLAARPERLRLTWVGHSNVFIQTPEHDLLVDPMFGERASPISFAGPERVPALPVEVEALPGVDVVLISHDHYDHLDEGSIERLEAAFSPLFVVPLGVGEALRGWGARHVIELDWWQYADVDGLRLHCLPAQHFSGRGLTNRDGTLWASWYVERLDAPEELRLYYAGDTGYAGHFRTIRERLGAPEVALLPIGAYLPRWFMAPVHVDPEEAVRAFLDLEAEHLVPLHWGTFDLADEPIHVPAEELARQAEKYDVRDRVHLLDIGASLTLPAEAAVR